MRHSLSGFAVAAGLLVSACGSPIGPCPNPAPFHEPGPPAPGYTVHFLEGHDAHRATYDLEQKYGFEAWSIYALGFTADFPDVTREALRCEAVVKFVERNVQPAPPPAAGWASAP
jgi:hypothetical protein